MVGDEWLSVWGSEGGVWWLVRLYPHLGRATRGVGCGNVRYGRTICDKLRVFIKIKLSGSVSALITYYFLLII